MNFAEVEREVAKLRQEVAAGRLTDEQFKARLRELMVQDEHGDWWMVGYESGQWHRHDGTDWVRADPPGRVTPESTPPPVSPPAHVPSRPAPQPVARLAVSRLDFWRELGLTLLGAVLYGGGNWANIVIVHDIGFPIGPFNFVPSLFGVLFGPWVGSFAGAFGLLISLVLKGMPWREWWGLIFGPFALGLLPGLMVKDARNWKVVLMAGVVASVIFWLDIAVTVAIVFEDWGSFGGTVAQALTEMPLNILLLPLFASLLVGPVRRWGLYWRDRR
jgi:hypothetical protein